MAISETGTSAATRPLTGDEYLESIRDGREIWLNGERVGDVTTHPGFRNSARSIARMHYGLPVRTKQYAVMFTVPMNAPGVRLISRVSYELQAATLGSPFDYPLSSRFDENDAILVMERVLVPWENVFVYGDADKVNTWAPATGVSSRMFLHGCTRLAVKLDFISGLLLKAVALTGTKDFRGVQVKVGEVVGWRNLFWGLSDAMVRAPVQGPAGEVQPNEKYGMAFRIFATEAYPAIKAIVQKAVGSGLIYLNSNAADFKREELRGTLDKYVRGSGGVPAVDRAKLMKLLWDAVGSEFGGRHELYERNYLGNDEGVRLETLLAAEMKGDADAFRGFADQCMSEYDLDGWTIPGYVDPGDVSVIGRRA